MPRGRPKKPKSQFIVLLDGNWCCGETYPSLDAAKKEAEHHVGSGGYGEVHIAQIVADGKADGITWTDVP